VFYVKGITQAEHVREYGAEEDLWPKMKELTGDRRNYHKEEPDFKYSGDRIKKNAMGGTLDT
jgi:hypothetical protein